MYLPGPLPVGDESDRIYFSATGIWVLINCGNFNSEWSNSYLFEFNNSNNKDNYAPKFGLEGSIIKSYRQDYVDKEKERIEKEKAKIEKIFTNQKLKINNLRNQNQELIVRNNNKD